MGACVEHKPWLRFLGLLLCSLLRALERPVMLLEGRGLGPVPELVRWDGPSWETLCKWTTHLIEMSLQESAQSSARSVDRELRQRCGSEPVRLLEHPGSGTDLLRIDTVSYGAKRGRAREHAHAHLCTLASPSSLLSFVKFS